MFRAVDQPDRVATLKQHREGVGETLVLVHGITATARGWLPVLPALAGHHDVIAVDLPGFGDSPPLADRIHPTAYAFADAIERHLDGLGLASVHLAGNSSGGWVALELARRGRARTVTAIAPLGLGTARENRRARRRLGLVHSAAAVVGPVVPLIARFAAGRAMLGAITLGRPWRHNRAEMATTARSLANSVGFRPALKWFTTNRAHGLEQIDRPVTVLWGTRDRVLRSRQAERFREQIPHAHVRVLRGLGHVPMTDDPDLVARAILETTAGARSTADGPSRAVAVPDSPDTA